MKKILFIAALFAGFSTAIAQDAIVENNKKQFVAVDQNEKYITMEELPSAVQTALKGDDYKGWTVSSIAKVEGKASTDGAMAKAHYKVQVTNGPETKTVKFDENGKKVA